MRRCPDAVPDAGGAVLRDSRRGEGGTRLEAALLPFMSRYGCAWMNPHLRSEFRLRQYIV